MIPYRLNEFNFSREVDFYLYFSLSNNFNFINLNILKTIFLKNLSDSGIWSELNKMFSSGILGFSKRFIYENSSFLTSSLLSVFLVEIYYSELDNYLFYLSLQYNSARSIVNYRNDFLTIYNLYISLYCPLKLEIILLGSFFSLKFLVVEGFIKFFKGFFPSLLYQSNLTFTRRLDFIRYKDKIFISINGSKDFTYLVYGKVFFFLRSRLQMDLQNSNVFPFGSKNIYFLGFNISSYSLKPVFYTKATFIYSLLSRLRFIKKKLMNLFLKRIFSEFSVILTHNSYNINFLNKFEYKRFWFNIFQLEVLNKFHAFQIYDYDESKFSIPYSYIKIPKFFSFSAPLKYSFNFYILKCYEFLSSIVRQYPILIQGSLFSMDSKFYMYFLEMKKKLFLSYIITPTGFGEFSLYCHPTLSVFDLSKTCNLKFHNFKRHLLIPIPYLYFKLKYLGFFHSVKFRPIGNSKYLFLSDNSIIKEFSSFSYMFLLWYRFSSNFSKLKLLVEYLRESCLLTLCRKHNKSKSWVNRVYSSSLFIYRGLFTFHSYFPSKLSLSLFSINFLSQDYFYFFPEEFFLEP
jgi:hypothetical protein